MTTEEFHKLHNGDRILWACGTDIMTGVVRLTNMGDRYIQWGDGEQLCIASHNDQKCKHMALILDDAFDRMEDDGCPNHHD